MDPDGIAPGEEQEQKKYTKPISRPLWRKLRNDLIIRILRTFKVNPLLLDNQESEAYKKFEDFCLKRLINSAPMEVPECFAFMAIMKYPLPREAMTKYSYWTGRHIEFPSLCKKVRQGRNNLMRYLESNQDITKELEKVLQDEY